MYRSINALAAMALAITAILPTLAQAAGDLEFGQCRQHHTISGLPENVDAVITGHYIDVTTDEITLPVSGAGPMATEITILKDFDFDVLGINHVVAIEQIYDVDCGCADIANNPRPWECTNGITDILLQTFESKANFSEETRTWPFVFGDAVEPLGISIVMHPADSAFAYRAESGRLKDATLKLGANGGSRLTVGTLAARIVLSEDGPRTVGPITLRFHVLDEPPHRSDPNTAFLISANIFDPASMTDFLEIQEDLQMRTVVLSDTNVRHLIEVINDEVKIRFLHLGVVGHHWITGTQLEVIRKNGKVELISQTDPFNFYGSSLPVSDLVLRKGDAIRFTCEYENTANATIDSLLGDTPVIPVGPFMSMSPCAIQAIYGEAQCDSQLIGPFEGGAVAMGVDCKP